MIKKNTKRPEKLGNLLGVIKQCIEEERFTLSTHAIQRQGERKINIAEVLHVLKTGYEEKNKTSFDEEHNAWKYAIRGKTKVGGTDVRIIVAFNEDGLLIITVIGIGK